MLTSIEPATELATELATRILAIPLLLSAAIFAQPIDITGWNGLPWGANRAAALGALRSLHVRVCPSCSSADTLVIEDYGLKDLVYQVKLLFLPKYGLASVTMTAADDRDSFQKVLAELTARYGRPALTSEYDGDREVTRTKWEWTKPHCKLSLASEYGDGTYADFTITYEARPGAAR
jgi:hypothetical protein